MILGKRTFEAEIAGYQTTNLDLHLSVTVCFCLFRTCEALESKLKAVDVDGSQGTDPLLGCQFSPDKRSEENSPLGQTEFSFTVYMRC